MSGDGCGTGAKGVTSAFGFPAVMRKFAGLLGPERVLTVTPRTPEAVPAAILRVAVMRLALSTLTSPTTTPEPLTSRVASGVKSAPVSAICTVDPACPLAGLSQTTVAPRFGGGGAGAFMAATSAHPGLLPSPA